MEVDADQHQPVDEVRPPQGDQQGDDPAVAPADEVGAAAHDLLEHADRLGRHVVVVERCVGVGGAAVAAPVEGDQPMVAASASPSASSSVSLFDSPPWSSTIVSPPSPRSSIQVGCPRMSIVYPCAPRSGGAAPLPAR